MTAPAVHIVAFGFSCGLPPDADLVFDVRFLSNPNYVDALRPLTGADEPVIHFMRALPETGPFLERLCSFVDFLLTQYARAEKPQVTIAIGCTGGRHRSVYVAEALTGHLRAQLGSDVRLTHRELAAA